MRYEYWRCAHLPGGVKLLIVYEYDGAKKAYDLVARRSVEDYDRIIAAMDRHLRANSNVEYEAQQAAFDLQVISRHMTNIYGENEIDSWLIGG